MVFFAAIALFYGCSPYLFRGSKGGTLLALKPERLLETVAGHKEAAPEMVPCGKWGSWIRLGSMVPSWFFDSSPWKITMLLIGKPSISMGYFPWRTVSHNQRGNFITSEACSPERNHGLFEGNHPHMAELFRFC